MYLQCEEEVHATLAILVVCNRTDSVTRSVYRRSHLEWASSHNLNSRLKPQELD